MIHILFDEQEIQERVHKLASEIQDFYRGKPLSVIVLLNGGMLFASDLIRQINLPMYVDSFAVSSYADNQSTGKLQIRSNIKLSVKERHVLILDDILDTGFTLQKTKQHFRNAGAVDVRSCVLLDKILPPGKKKQEISEWHCFQVPDCYIVGYGLDSNELYRNLPYIGYVKND